MRYEFTATWAHVSIEPGAWATVCVGSDPDGDKLPENSILIQRALDGATGIDRVYLEWNDQGNAGFGGLTSVELSRARLVIELTAPMKPVPTNVPLDRALVEALPDVSQLVVNLAIDDHDFERVAHALAELIFVDCSELRVRE